MIPSLRILQVLAIFSFFGGIASMLIHGSLIPGIFTIAGYVVYKSAAQSIAEEHENL